MVPERAAAIPNRPLLRIFMATLNPSPSSVYKRAREYKLMSNRSDNEKFIGVNTVPITVPAFPMSYTELAGDEASTCSCDVLRLSSVYQLPDQ